MIEFINVNTLLGKTIVSIEGMEKDSREIIFKCSDGKTYIMYHEQDCCESVYLEDVCGDVKDLIGSPILKAEEITNTNEKAKRPYEESWTWTYYKFATIKGSVDLRWYGCSNGYYSERVDFIEEKKE